MKAILSSTIILALLFASCAAKPVAATTTAEVVTEKPVDLTADLMEGKYLYANNCAKCHELVDPKDFTKENWQPILKKMQRKANLDDATMASISNYISSQL